MKCMLMISSILFSAICDWAFNNDFNPACLSNEIWL